MEWFFPPYVMRRTKPRHFGEPDDGTATILKAHPANTEAVTKLRRFVICCGLRRGKAQHIAISKEENRVS
jgi:hypothetical protein